MRLRGIAVPFLMSSAEDISTECISIARLESMTRVIEAIYERGVLRPLERIDLEEGERVTIIIERKRGTITKEFIESLRKAMERLPIIRVDLKRAEELYAEGKMHSR